MLGVSMQHITIRKFSQGFGAVLNIFNSAMSLMHLWGFQIFAATLATTSFILLVVVTSYYSDRPLLQWVFQPLFSINGLIALLSTTIKSAIMVPITSSIGQEKWTWFQPSTPKSEHESKLGMPLQDLQYIDDASRGPWGSSVWLSKHILQPRFVNIGAAITVLAIALDAFSQNIVSIESRSVGYTSSSARVLWAQHVSSMDRNAWLAAVYQGIFNPDVPDLPVSCPTGNCTWGTIPSIGVCGRCLDITDKMPLQWTSCSKHFCNYTFSDNRTTLVDGPRPYQNLSLGELLDIRFHDNTPNGPDRNATYQVKVVEISPISDVSFRAFGHYDKFAQHYSSLSPGFEVIGIPLRNGLNATLLDNVPLGNAYIIQCRLWYCLQGYTISMISGQIRETMRIKQPGWGFDRMEQTSQDVIYAFNESVEFNMQNQNFSLINNEGLVWTDVSRVVSGSAYLERQDFSYPDYSNYANSSWFQEMVDPSLYAWDRNRHDPNKWIANIAKSLTNTVRQQNQFSRNEYTGTMYRQELYITLKQAVKGQGQSEQNIPHYWKSPRPHGASEVSIQWLIRVGVDVNSQDYDGLTPISYAVFGTPLPVAAQFSHIETLNFILEKVASSIKNRRRKYDNIADIDGWTPLAWATRPTVEGFWEHSQTELREITKTVQCLLDEGADGPAQFTIDQGDDAETFTSLTMAELCNLPEEAIHVIKDAQACNGGAHVVAELICKRHTRCRGGAIYACRIITYYGHPKTEDGELHAFKLRPKCENKFKDPPEENNTGEDAGGAAKSDPS
ncbi:hypothetical protein CHU98_g10408 [Xylaria longipes]|nr:hypothetical protein CHU98_g10408 [Xylaria longipes]